jgi:hypothetical protein
MRSPISDCVRSAPARDLLEVLLGLAQVPVARRQLARERDAADDQLLPRPEVAVAVVADQQPAVTPGALLSVLRQESSSGVG